METIAKLAIGAAVLGGGWWLLSGTANAAGPAASAAGQADGCAAGTADGKAGYPSSRPPWADGDTTSTDAKLDAAAKASGSPKDYLAAYAAAYDSCWNDNFVAPKGGGPPAKTPPVTPPPGATGPNKAKAGSAYNAGCSAGARDGYTDGYNGASNSPHPTGAAASGNSTAYTAAYKDAYGGAYLQGQEASFSPFLPLGPTESDGMAKIAELSVGCAGKFEVWWGVYLSSVKTSGVGVQTGACQVEVGYMGMQRLRAPGRVGRRGPVLGGGQAVGWPGAPMEHKIYSPQPDVVGQSVQPGVPPAQDTALTGAAPRMSMGDYNVSPNNAALQKEREDAAYKKGYASGCDTAKKGANAVPVVGTYGGAPPSEVAITEALNRGLSDGFNACHKTVSPGAQPRHIRIPSFLVR